MAKKPAAGETPPKGGESGEATENETSEATTDEGDDDTDSNDTGGSEGKWSEQQEARIAKLEKELADTRAELAEAKADGETKSTLALLSDQVSSLQADLTKLRKARKPQPVSTSIPAPKDKSDAAPAKLPKEQQQDQPSRTRHRSGWI